MKKVISFPHLGDYSIPIKFFISHLTDIEVRCSPPITKKTIEIGDIYSPSDVCVPFKYNLGNFIESLDGGANILFQAGGGCRYRYYAELQEKILRDMGYEFDFIKLTSKERIYIQDAYKIFKRLNEILKYRTFLYYGFFTILMIYYMDKLDEIIRKNIGFELEKNSFLHVKEKMLTDFSNCTGIFQLTKFYFRYKRKFRKIKIKKKKPIKIGIIGELYTAMEPYSTYELEKKLAKNNIEIKRFTNLSYLLWQKALFKKRMLKKCKKYCKYSLGADGLDNVYRSIYLAKKKYHGIIHTKPFGCTPEVGAIPIIKNVCEDFHMPIIFFSFDTEQEDGGVDTRLEAFFDLLKYRKDKR